MIRIKPFTYNNMYLFLALLAFALPYPSFSLVSQVIILLTLIFLFTNQFKRKLIYLKNNFKFFLGISVGFFIYVLGALYTTDFHKAINELVLKLPLFIIPLIFLSEQHPRKLLFYFLKYFSRAVVFFSFLAFLTATYFEIKNIGNYYSYQNFAIILNKHTTYLALMVSISLIYRFYLLISTPNSMFYELLIIFYHFLILYFISNRISFIALTISFVFLIWTLIKAKFKYFLLLFFPIAFFSIFFLPNFQKRFQPKTWKKTNMTESFERAKNMSAVWDYTLRNHLFFGLGTGSKRDALYEEYKHKNLKNAYKHKYNAHNQYLEFFLVNGLFGATIFIAAQIFLLIVLLKKRDYFGISLFIIFIIFMMTESILERQTGVVLYAIILTLILNQFNKTKFIKSND